MVSTRWLCALAAAVFTDVMLSIAVWGPEPALHNDWRYLSPLVVAWHVTVLVALMGTLRSVRRDRQRLFHLGQSLDAAGSTSSDWHWETDKDGIYTYNSPGVVAILGYKPGELRGASNAALRIMPAQTRTTDTSVALRAEPSAAPAPSGAMTLRLPTPTPNGADASPS
jgi:PAS domain-containing protein